jgi:hypothetical protein
MADRYGRGMPDEVRLRQVIEVVGIRGAGTPDDIARRVTRYYDPETGHLLAEDDSARSAATCSPTNMCGYCRRQQEGGDDDAG